MTGSDSKQTMCNEVDLNLVLKQPLKTLQARDTFRACILTDGMLVISDDADKLLSNEVTSATTNDTSAH